MQLYYAPGSISVVVAIALHEAGLEFEPVRLDFPAGEQTKPAYHRINPKGRVPALVTGSGTLTETGAILDYIAATRPEAGLVPLEPFAAGKMREAMYYLASTMHVNHAHKMRGYRWADRQESFDDMTGKVRETMAASAAHVEEYMLQSPFVLGESFSLADPYLFVVSTWLAGDGVDTSVFPKLTAFMDKMENRDSVMAVRAQGIL